jgi:ribosomal protein L33
MISSAGTGYRYIMYKNPKTIKNPRAKMAVRKYDPVVNMHVMFEEQKFK